MLNLLLLSDSRLIPLMPCHSVLLPPFSIFIVSFSGWMLYLPLVSPPWMGWTETWSRWQNNKLVSGAGQKLKVTSDSTVSQSEHKLVWRSDLYGNFAGLCRQYVNIQHIWYPGMLNPILSEAFFVLYWRSWLSISLQVWLVDQTWHTWNELSFKVNTRWPGSI